MNIHVQKKIGLLWLTFPGDNTTFSNFSQKSKFCLRILQYDLISFLLEFSLCRWIQKFFFFSPSIDITLCKIFRLNQYLFRVFINSFNKKSTQYLQCYRYNAKNNFKYILLITVVPIFFCTLSTSSLHWPRHPPAPPSNT